jgi:cytoskeletal protein CcmA (bactofilin family)
MAIFTQSPAPKRETVAPQPQPQPETALKKEPDPGAEFAFGRNVAPSPAAAPRPAEREAKESLIASDLSIEGKIQGAGHIRIAGKFKGDVHVDGDLTIEVGAKVNGGVRARRVTIAGELEGNIESATRVELLDSGAMIGDVKASILTVAPGARMRGQVEFGWEDKDAKKPTGKAENGAGS